MTPKAGFGDTLVVATRTEHEKVVGGYVFSAPRDFADGIFNQTEGQSAGRRTAPLSESTVECNVLEDRVFTRHSQESCLEWAAVELLPVEVPPGGRFGQVADARKGVLDDLDRRFGTGCRGTQEGLRANS